MDPVRADSPLHRSERFIVGGGRSWQGKGGDSTYIRRFRGRVFILSALVVGEPVRRKRSTAVESFLLTSALVHGGLILVFLLMRGGGEPPQAQALDVYSISEAELAAMEAKLPEFGQTVDSTRPELTEEQLKALPRDREVLPEHVPSPEAVTKANGQIVELADPMRAQQAPADAQYLSRANHRVDQETAAQMFKMNPDVVAPTFSKESSLAHAEAGKVNARLEGDPGQDRKIAGSQDGEKVASLPPEMRRAQAEQMPQRQEVAKEMPQRAPEPTRAPVEKKQEIDDLGETLARKEIPREFLPTSPALAKLNPMLRPQQATLAPNPLKAGTEAREGAENGSDRRVAAIPERKRFGQGSGGGEGGTSPVSVQQGELKGAPSNDRLNERKGDATMLNAKEFKYFGYMQLIRRQVNFYWTQALDNVGQVREKLSRNEYTTTLNVSLDRKGNLKSAKLVRSCGVKNFDEATLQAFKIAAPFPPPPEGLLTGDVAELPGFEFTVQLTRGGARYSAIDPRANVLFPGITFPR